MAKLAQVPPVGRPTHVARSAALALGPITHAVLRIGAGLLFFQHGLQKFGFFGGKAVPLASQMGVAGILELVGGALVLIGLATRPVALVLAAEMVVAYVIAHLSKGGWPIDNGGEVALLFALIFVFLAGNGAGPYSMGARRG